MSFWRKIRLALFPPKWKYRPGQVCLIIGGLTYQHRKYIGVKVVLGRQVPFDMVGNSRNHWSMDPQIREIRRVISPVGSYNLLWPECQLLPLDDPDIQREIENEKIEDRVGTIVRPKDVAQKKPSEVN